MFDNTNVNLKVVNSLSGILGIHFNVSELMFDNTNVNSDISRPLSKPFGVRLAVLPTSVRLFGVLLKAHNYLDLISGSILYV